MSIAPQKNLPRGMALVTTTGGPPQVGGQDAVGWVADDVTAGVVLDTLDVRPVS
jgi:hypothetical protein